MKSRSGELDDAGLLDQQMALFEECLIEDSAKCMELDQALTLLETQLKQSEGQLDALVGIFGQSKLDRASARVLKAASKFGPEQEKIAQLWVDEVRRSGEEVNPLALLEQQTSLFGECLLDEDGGSSRCDELNEALGALQLCLGVRGRVVSTGRVPVSGRVVPTRSAGAEDKSVRGRIVPTRTPEPVQDTGDAAQDKGDAAKLP